VKKDHRIVPVAEERNGVPLLLAQLVAVVGEIDQGSKKMKVNVQIEELIRQDIR
jgi:hypothetical protein